jgi:hypothetical protein
LLILIFTFAGLSNAFGMVPPVYALQTTLAGWLNTNSEGLTLFVLFAGLNVALPVGLGLGAAWLSRRLAGRKEPLRVALACYAPALLPLAFAIWLAHYAGFHFLSSALAIVPVWQNFLLDHGLAWGGAPDWTMGPLLPGAWLDPVEMVVILVGFAVSFYAVGVRARHNEPPDGLLAQLPWLALVLALAAAAMFVFYLPMEMRGTAF